MHPTTIRLSLAVLSAAVLVPAAAASTRPDDTGSGPPAGSVLPQTGSTYDVGGIEFQAGAPLHPEAIRPDDRAGVRGAASESSTRPQTGSPFHEDSSLDPAFTAALANRRASGGQLSYTPQQLRALKTYSNASFAQKQVLLAGGRVAFTPRELKALRVYGTGWFAKENDLTAGNDPQTREDPYLRALRIRGEALDAKYGETPYQRALRIRGEAMNKLYAQYGTPTVVRPDDRAGVRAVDTVPVATSSGGFDWNDAGIGAIGAFGLSLLAAGAMLLGLHVLHQRRDKIAAL
jgi:hypothetical protein